MVAGSSRHALGIAGVAAAIALQGCGSPTPAPVPDPFAPEPLGTLMPDGSRWGAWDPSGVEIVGDDTVLDSLFETRDIELVASGFRWTEGPTWVEATSSFLFSDTIDARIYRWTADGGVKIVSEQSGGYDGSNVENFTQWFEPGSNGIALVGDQLYINQHPTHRLVRMQLADLKDGMEFHENTFEVLADTSPEGRRLNSPNDVIVASSGDVYFTDPIYGFLIKGDGYGYLNNELGEPPDQPYLDELCESVGAGYKGVYRIRDGTLELVTQELERPNGLALSNDETILWVANSDKETPSWTAFTLSDSLPLAKGQILDPTTLNDPDMVGSVAGAGLSDGFKIDSEGYIWASTPGGLVVIDPAASAVLAKVKFGINLSNVRFGANGDVWITGLGHIWRMKRKVDMSKNMVV